MTEIEALLCRGGWDLVDPRPIAAQHPDTFTLPTCADLAALRPGSLVRAAFRTVTIADPVRDQRDPYDEQGRPVLVAITERMWAIVVAGDDESLACVMDNHPFATHTRLLPHDRVQIPLTHVIATGDPIPDLAGLHEFLAAWENDPQHPLVDPRTPVDPLGPPRIGGSQARVVERTGVPAHPPIPFANVLVSKNVTPESVPLYGARFEPVPERGDCGWVFFTGPPDLEKVAQTIGFEVLTLQAAQQRHPRIQPYLAMAPGWGFTLLPDGADDIYPAA